MRVLAENEILVDAGPGVAPTLQASEQKEVKRGPSNARPYGLTLRELTVLHLVAEGKKDKMIAGELDISVFTVRKHLSRVLMKMNAATRTEASVRALQAGLLATLPSP